MVSLVSTPVSAPAALPLPERPWLVAQAGAVKPATPLTRTVSERALQDMIDGKLTPQQADRLIRAAVTTDGVLVKLLGTLKWGAIASLPFLLRGDADPRVLQSKLLTGILRRGDLNGFFGGMKALAQRDSAKIKGIEAIATLTANLLAAGKPHSASRVLQQVIGALNKEGLVNLGSGNATDLALEAVMAAFRRQQPAQPQQVLGPPVPEAPQAPPKAQAPAVTVTAQQVLNHFTAQVPKNQQATYKDVLITMMQARGINVTNPHEVAKWVTNLFHSEKLKLLFQHRVNAALSAKVPPSAAPRQQLIDQVASSPAAAGTRHGPTFEAWRDAIRNKLDRSGVSNSTQTYRFFNTLAPHGVISPDSQIWRAISADAHKRLDQRMGKSQAPAALKAPAIGSTADSARLQKTRSKGGQTVPASTARTPEEIDTEWRKLGDSSEAGGQLVREAAREGWSENDVLDYIRRHPDQNLNQVLAALRDGALGVGGGAPPGGTRSGVTASAGEPAGKAGSGAPGWKPSADAVLKRQTEIYKKIRDSTLTGENITVQVEGKTIDASALDRELVASNGRATGFTARDMVKLAGGLKDATINIRLHSRAISIIQRHPQLEGSNKLTVYLDVKSVYFINLKVNQTSSKPGFGTALRLQQLVAAEKLGMRGATMTAARSKDYPTGYATWPKLGFDAELPDKVKPELTEYLQANSDVAKKLGLKPDALPTHLMLSELLFNADGSDHQGLQAWWKAKGIGTDMGINFDRNSPSGRRFHKMAEELGWLPRP